MDNELLKSRVKGQVRFSCYHDSALYYECADGFIFPVPITETTNDQGSSPTFLAEDKGIFFMRWIRKAMES